MPLTPMPPPSPRLVRAYMADLDEPAWLVWVIVRADDRELAVLYEFATPDGARDFLVIADEAPDTVALHAWDLARQSPNPRYLWR